MSINTLFESPPDVLETNPSDDMLERLEAYNRAATISFTEWIARIFARNAK
jgi:hypothetical protein